jgi:7,8-dihydroneopterin aldolase/epimerase/oxygenase
MDKIFLKQVAVSATIGIYDHEKIKAQPIFIDLEAAVNANTAAATDDINATVDYAKIYHYLCEWIPHTRFQLLESLAVALSENLIAQFSLSWLRLTITKKPTDLPHLQGAGIIIERQK